MFTKLIPFSVECFFLAIAMIFLICFEPIMSSVAMLHKHLWVELDESR